jgi:hypothetical protein
MARVVDGVSTIYRAARTICRVVGRFGIAGLVARTTPEFTAAVQGLVIACQAFEALDDQPLEIDRNPPLGSEDV